MKKRSLIAAALVISMCFAGCGSKESASSVEETVASSEAASETVSNSADDTVISEGAVSSEEESSSQEESKAEESKDEEESKEENSSQEESKSEESSAAESKVNKVGNAEDSSAEQSKEPEIDFTIVNAGDKIENDFVQMTIDSASVAQELYPKDDGTQYFLSGYADKDSEQYLYIKGTIKNVSGAAYSADEMYVQFKFDDKYEYTGTVSIDNGEGDFYGDYMKPLTSADYYIWASVPDEIISSYKTCEIKFVFHDEFKHDYSSNFGEYENRYMITVTK